MAQEAGGDALAQAQGALENPEAVKAAIKSLNQAGPNREGKEEVRAGVTLWKNQANGYTAMMNVGGNTRQYTIKDETGETENWPLYVQKFAEPEDAQAAGGEGTDAEGNISDKDKTPAQIQQEQQAAAEAAALEAEQAKFNSIGPTWEETTGTPMDPQVRDNLLRSEKDAREFCESQTEESFMCKGNNLMRYIGGASNWGLEWKLANGRGVQTQMTPDKDGNLKETATIGDELVDAGINLALVQEATESMALLTAFLGNEGGDCEEVKNRVSMYKSGGKDGLILYGGDKDDDGNPTQGIYISPINALQLTALKKMQESSNCGPGNLRNVTGSMYSQKAKNAVKGTFYELTIQAAVEINAADQMPRNTPREKAARATAIRDSFSRIALKLEDKIGELREIADEGGPNEIARDLEAQFDHEVIQEQLSLVDAFVGSCSIKGDEAAELSMRTGGIDIENDETACAEAGGTWEKDDQALKNWVLDEIMAVRRAIQVIDSDGAEATGQSENRTGGREDTKFLFDRDKGGLTAEQRARKAGELLGATPVKVKEGVWSLGAGQKRIVEMGKIKLGELNNEDRRETIYKGEELASNPVQGGFYKKMRDMQFGPVGGGAADVNSAREQAAEEYAYGTDPQNPGLETRIKEATKALAEDTTYKSEDGKVRTQSAKVLLQNIKSQIGDLLSLEQLKDSIVGKALMKGGGKRGDAKARDAEWRDFGDPQTRKRAQEAIQRSARYAILSKDLKDPAKKQQAQDYIIKNMLMTGANAVDMGQFITDDEGNTLTISHNQGLQEICDAHKNDSIEFSIKPGSTTTSMVIRDSNSQYDGLEVKWSQQGTWAGPKDAPVRNTRSQTDYPLDTVVLLDKKNGVRGQSVKNRRASRQSNIAQQSQPQAIAAGTFQEYIKGQMELLETILSQTK